MNGNAWTELEITGPPGRYGAVEAPVGNTLVLFGGRTSALARFSDTWSWNGTAWSELNVTGPSARAYAVMATP